MNLYLSETNQTAGTAIICHINEICQVLLPWNVIFIVLPWVAMDWRHYEDHFSYGRETWQISLP